ncbi:MULTISPECIES: DUF4124 domain-containing protein [unclassified Pseudomonas]|uniref:DUF4124 domain-containing protein n=1 Tax=unclassified Pseudomonas TaxID=196821 RepID=UPI002600E896|nr:MULTISPECIES: DUF4124 domain-containing protein [unclassified Pseudomonas]
MPLDIRTTVITALLALPATVEAATVHRCEDETGNITFTASGCPPGQSVKLQQAHNSLPGTTPAMRPPAREPLRRQSERELVVIGRRDDGCGNVLSAEQRRRAIINQQTPAGMTKRDVESLLGKPDKIIGRNAEQRYVYEEKKGRSRQVQFDEHGCVKDTRAMRKTHKQK